MGNEIKAAPGVAAEPASKRDTAERNREIIAASARGVPMAKIARTLGLTRQRVHQIVARKVRRPSGRRVYMGLIRQRLEANPEASDEAIAVALGVSPFAVAAARPVSARPVAPKIIIATPRKPTSWGPDVASKRTAPAPNEFNRLLGDLDLRGPGAPRTPPEIFAYSSRL
jgi:hypothetical protein